jgi:hypothetical protein
MILNCIFDRNQTQKAVKNNNNEINALICKIFAKIMGRIKKSMK